MSVVRERLNEEREKTGADEEVDGRGRYIRVYTMSRRTARRGSSGEDLSARGVVVGYLGFTHRGREKAK